MEEMLCAVLLAVVILLLNAGLSDLAPCTCATTPEAPTPEPTTCVYYLRSQYIRCGEDEGSGGSETNGITCNTSVITRGLHNLTAGVYRYQYFRNYLYAQREDGTYWAHDARLPELGCGKRQFYLLPERFGGLSGISITNLTCYGNMVNYFREIRKEEYFTTYKCALCWPTKTTCLWGLKNSTGHYTASIRVIDE